MNKILYDISQPMSGDQIKKIMNDDVSILLYRNLKNYNNLDELFMNSNNVALLYELKPNYGHWVCLINQPLLNRIEYFDSYAYIPDYHKRNINKKFLIESGQKVNILSLLLYNSNKEIYYNEQPMQLKKNIISTCGRHCCVRMLYGFLPLEEYQKIIYKNNKKNADLLVTYIISEIDKK